ncbi:MAG: hypothetical protein QM820_49855 [Minicystis sp.]
MSRPATNLARLRRHEARLRRDGEAARGVGGELEAAAIVGRDAGDGAAVVARDERTRDRVSLRIDDAARDRLIDVGRRRGARHGALDPARRRLHRRLDRGGRLGRSDTRRQARRGRPRREQPHQRR